MPAKQRHRKALISLLGCGLITLTGCGLYDVTVNERTVYTPTPLLKDYVVEDQALADCLAQTIQDRQISGVSQLRDLRCSNAGIASVRGLERFTALERLDLARNAIGDVSAISALSSLRELYLNDNRLASAAQLGDLPALTLLYLDGNTQMSCPPSSQFKHVNDLQLPRHCDR